MAAPRPISMFEQVKIIGWMFLAAVLLSLSQLIGSLLRFRL